MLIYKIIFFLYIFFWAWPKGACWMQTDRSTNRQINKQTISVSYAKELANCQGAGSANSGAYYIPVLTPDAASRPAAPITWPIFSLFTFTMKFTMKWRTDRQTKNCQKAGSANSGAYYSGADSAYGFSACGLDRSAYGLATSASTQLWAWPSNLCIESLQKLLCPI